MKILGLIGGIASGKSAVAAELAALGTVVLDADAAAHEVISRPSVQQVLIDRWGNDVISEDGETDRAAVARRVFGKTEGAAAELRFLEETLHPRIRQEFEAELARLSEAGTEVAVIDAPLLLEAGWQGICDVLIFVDSPREDRLRRTELRNWTETEFAEREAAQMPIAEKRDRSDHILDNSGTLANLREQVRTLYSNLGFTQDKT